MKNVRYSPAQIADMVGIHPATVRRWADSNLIECTRDFRGWRWFPEPRKTIKRIRELMNGEVTIEELKAS